jgi:hypothetical protein
MFDYSFAAYVSNLEKMACLPFTLIFLRIRDHLIVASRVGKLYHIHGHYLIHITSHKSLVDEVERAGMADDSV